MKFRIFESQPAMRIKKKPIKMKTLIKEVRVHGFLPSLMRT